MFNVVFYKAIWDGLTPETSKTMALVQREEILPFPPSLGIQMFWGRDKPQAPASVRWDVSDQKFLCAMQDEFPHEIDLDEYDFEWLLANAEISGWKLIVKQSV